MFQRRAAASRIAAVAAVVIAGAWLALGQAGLDAGYLSERFSRLGGDDPNVAVRVDRVESFLAQKQETSVTDLMLGSGFATQDIVARGLVGTREARQLRAGYTDNVFLLELYNHGLVAAVLYVVLLVGALVRVLRASRRRSASPWLGGLAAALTTALILHFFDNYFSEAVFMQTFLWILVGLAMGLAAHDSDGRSELPGGQTE
jgi:cell division protein FtsW (lipid II flippase)